MTVFHFRARLPAPPVPHIHEPFIAPFLIEYLDILIDSAAPRGLAREIWIDARVYADLRMFGRERLSFFNTTQTLGEGLVAAYRNLVIRTPAVELNPLRQLRPVFPLLRDSVWVVDGRYQHLAEVRVVRS